jgi:homocysteine S-methyltransferase
MLVPEGIPIDVPFFDGAFGTYYRSLTGVRQPCEMANLTDPARVLSIHRAYVEAGANAVKTNTFAANPDTMDAETLERVLAAGARLAVEAAGGRAQVFGDMGPVASAERDAADDYLFLAQAFARLGLTRFLFETMDEFEPLIPAIRWIRGQVPGAVIAVSFAASQDGYTGAGHFYRDLIQAARAEGADFTGLNCVSGPAHMLGLIRNLDLSRGDILAMPNAGYPARVNGRLLYEDNPGYFAEKLLEMKRLGVRALGGCCGTTPEHIRRAVARCEGSALSIPAEVRPQAKPEKPVHVSPLAERLSRGLVALVEVDPPVDADTGHLLDAARRLKRAGADALTLADSPLARARADSLMMAALAIREAGVDAIPHLTCRDRNRIAMRGALLAAHALGVRGALAVTGDPIPGASHGPGESAADKGVFNFNSFTLIDFVRGMNQGPFQSAPMFILAALNTGAQNFDAELRRAEKKLARGADGFVTQSIFSMEGVKNLRRAREALGAPVIAGIMPVASHKNAVFLNSEVPGVSIPKAFVDSLEGQPRDVVTGRTLAFCRELIGEARPFSAGFSLMTPMRRVDLTEALLNMIKGGT